MSEDVELRTLEPVQNSHAAEPCRAKLEAQAAVDAVAHAPSGSEKQSRPSSHLSNRDTPFRSELRGVEIALAGTRGLPEFAGDVQPPAAPVDLKVLKKVRHLQCGAD